MHQTEIVQTLRLVGMCMGEDMFQAAPLPHHTIGSSFFYLIQRSGIRDGLPPSREDLSEMRVLFADCLARESGCLCLTPIRCHNFICTFCASENFNGGMGKCWSLGDL